MRKIVLLMHVSLDGYAAGPNGEMDWIVYDGDIEKYSHDLHASMDTALFGHTTFNMMAGYWRTVPDNPNSTPTEREHAAWLDNATKIVISRTLDKVDWQNTLVIKEQIAAEINKIKQQPGKNIWMIGSISTAHLLTELGLIDEYMINVSPVILGNGKPLFPAADQLQKMKLIASRTFGCGVVGLRYEPEGN